MTDKRFELKTVNDVRNLEVPSAGVSNKYVPISTTKLIETLQPEFQFVSGYQYGKKTSRHHVDLENDDGDRIRIYNSFDATMALRVYLVSDDFQFNLVSDDRVIHRGDKARNVNEDANLEEIKLSIINTIPNVKELKVNLSKTPIDLDSELADLIKESISHRKLYYFEKVRKTGKYEFINYTDTVAEKAAENGKPLSIYAYINLTIKNYIDGNYGLKRLDGEAKGAILGGRKTTSPFVKVQTLNDITRAIEEKLPEYLI